jgi:hypothetical protein
MGLSMRFQFLRAVLRGLGSPSEIFGEKLEPQQAESAADALRSDWERIGQTFRAVIGREAARETNSRAEKRRSAA